MSLEFAYRLQLLTVQEPAIGFLVKSFDELCAGLQALSPLAANLRLPYTKSGALMTTSVGIPGLHQQVRAAAIRTAAQTLTTGQVANVTFESTTFDIGGMWNPSFPTRLTVPPGGEGLYLVVGLAPFAANAAGQRQIQLLKNGNAINATVANVPAAAAFTVAVEMTQLATAIAGDYFELLVYQDSGGFLNVSSLQMTAMKLAAL
jgi:hypothetical protein